MQGSIVVLSLFLIVASVVAQKGFDVEYRKFDSAIKAFRQPSPQEHIANLQKAIPLRVVVDLDQLAQYGPRSVPADCFDDTGKAVYCQYDQVGENVVSPYVDVVVKLPYASYPTSADSMKEDSNNPDGDKRQDMYTNYVKSTDFAIQTAVNQSSCEMISNNVDSVGYTTKYGYTVGIVCPDDRTYRTKLAVNPNFYNNVVQATLGRTLRLGPNLASNVNVDLSKATTAKEVEEYRRKLDAAHEDARKLDELYSIEDDVEVEERQTAPGPTPTTPVSSTGFDYSHPACGGVWYKDYLDGSINGQCVGQTCEYIKAGGAGTDFYLMDSGVQMTHPEFKNSVQTGRLKNMIVLNRTEIRWIMHDVRGVDYAGVLAAPKPLPTVPQNFVPFHDVSPLTGLTKLPISKFTGKALTSGATFTGSISSLAASLYTYLEDPIIDLNGHGTGIAAILIGDTLGIAKEATLTSFKVVTNKAGVIEYAMKAAVKRVTTTAIVKNLLRRQNPMVMVTGVNFYYPHDCNDGVFNCALDMISSLQTAIRWGITVVTPSGNGFVNARDYAFQPPGLSVPAPFPSSFDICHWARYIKDVQPDADATYDGIPAYFPQMLITGTEITGYTHIRPIRITGFNHNQQMVPTLVKSFDAIGNSVLDINAFNYGDCIDFAVPGSHFEKLAVLNTTIYGDMDTVGMAWGFTETDADYPGGITDWFPVDYPAEWEASGKIFRNGYKSMPFVSSGTSFAAPVAAATIMSTIIARWPVIKPTLGTAGSFMKKVFDNVNLYNVAGTSTQTNFGYEVCYTALANLNGIWGEPDPEQSDYPAKKTPTFKRLKMNKVISTCV